MKTIVILLAAVCVQLTLWGETVIGPTSSTNRILISTNETILITATADGINDLGSSVVINGVTNTVYLDGYYQEAPRYGEPGIALTGPAEIVLYENTLLTFYRLTNSPVISLILNTNPVSIDIPTNKTLQVFTIQDRMQATFQRGGASVNLPTDNEPIRPRIELSGPGTLLVSQPSLGYANSQTIFSYCFSDDAVTLPNLGIIKGPIGTFEIVVQKSLDLTNWVPVVEHITSDFPNAYYRVRIQQ